MIDKDTTYKILLREFLPDELEWRIQQSGKTRDGKIWAIVLPYITSRAVMERLDEAFGFLGWSVETEPIAGADGTEGGFISSIIIHTENGNVIKQDGAPATAIEPIKGGISDAFKRAAVHLGVGRYLYRTGVCFADINPNGKYKGKVKTSSGEEHFRWDAPTIE